MKPIPETKLIFAAHGGMVRTKDLYAEKIFYKDVQQLVSDGLIEKIRYGYYQWIDEDNLSEARLVNQLFPDGILNMDAALFYHDAGLTSGDIDGNQMRIYDKERTICDCLRYRNKMDKVIAEILAVPTGLNNVVIMEAGMEPAG